MPPTSPPQRTLVNIHYLRRARGLSVDQIVGRIADLTGLHVLSETLHGLEAGRPASPEVTDAYARAVGADEWQIEQ